MALAFTALFLFFMGYINSFYFWMFYILLVAFFIQPLGSLVDTMALKYVKVAKSSSYGQLRLWGSIGWGAASFGVGVLINIYDIQIIFPIAAALMLLLLLILVFYKEEKTFEKHNKIKLIDIKNLLKTKKLVLFYLFLIFFGIVIAPINVFINLYYSDIGTSYDILGLAYVFQSVSEIPFFFLGVKFISRFGSQKIILLAILLTALRMFLYGIVSTPEIAIFVGLFQGFTLSLFLVAVIDYAHQMIPDNLSATGQALVWATHFGIGVTFGNILIGYLNDLIGMQAVMLYDSFVAGIIFLIALYYYKKQKALRSI